MAIPAAVAAWKMEQLQLEGIRARNELHADHLAARIETSLSLRLGLLEKLAQDLGRGRLERGAFEDRARRLVAVFPELQAVNWLDAEGVARWVEPFEDNAPVLHRDIDDVETGGPALAQVRTTGQAAASPIVDLLQGGRGFATYIPVDGGAGGFVNGVFRLADFARAWVPPELSKHVDVALTNPTSGGVASPDLQSERAIGLLGRAFVLSVRPSPGGREMSSWGLLGFGILVAVLVGLLTHGILVSRESARAEATHRLALLAAVPDHMIRLGPEMETLAYHRSAGLPSIPCHLPAERWMPPRLRVAIERAWAERRTTEAHVDLDGRSYAVRVVPEPERFLVLSLRDITDQQRLEEERTLLTELVRSNGQLAAVFGQDGRLEYLNPAGQRMLGLQLPTSAPLESFLEAPEELTRVLGGGPGWSGRLELRSRSGVDIPAQVAAFPIQTAHGSKLGILALDLRETVELERRLLQSQKLQAIGTLAAGVAHDFNNALTVFRAGLELVEEHPGLPADLLEDTALMRQAEASATQVARQLLAFSRPGPMDEGCFPVDEVLAGAAKMFARIVRDDIELSWDLSAEGARVDGDPGALQQVILNLVSNARDALQGGGRIHVSTRKTSDRVSIAVSDDGVGMPEAQLARAFEPFFTTKSVGRGTGLGLAMVKRVTEELGGTVDLESARGVGTKVSLHLPLAGASTRSPRPRRHLSVVRPRARVVLAEDDPAVRAILARGLKRAGHLVAEAADGDAALARLEEPADALVADVVMPGLGGEALARRAREASPEIFVVLMSGHRDLDWQALRENTGFEVLAKPIAPRTLLDAIAAHLATRGAS